MAQKANIIVDQGSDWSTTIPITSANGSAIDLTAYNLIAHFAKSYDANTKITISAAGNANGMLQLVLYANATANLAYGRYVWNAKIVNESSNATTRIVEGQLTIRPEV